MKKRVNPANDFPAAFITQLFIQGLRPEYAINVQAAVLANLDAAILSAQQWETGHVMASPQTNNGTDQAIKQLTDQIAQLSINLAQKLTPTTVNYADTSSQAPPI